MKCVKCAVLTVIGCLIATTIVMGQTPDTGTGQDAPAQDGSTPAQTPDADWTIGSLEISGLLDAYYSLNFNHPSTRENQLRNFDVNANQFSLNMGKIVISSEPSPVGFRLDFGFGRAFEMIHAAESGPDIFRHIEQAYVSYKPGPAKGLQFDFGKFVTAAGAEVIETQNNWNYSRSLLFALAIPYYHFGLRATMPITSNISAGTYLVNGWNNVEDNNSGKTIGLFGTISNSKISWTNTFHYGPEQADTNSGKRQVYDTTLLLTPTSQANFYVNFDYGIERRLTGGKDRWVGIAGAGRYAFNRWFALASRAEWFNDADGFSTGTVQKLKEVTFTAEFIMREGLLSRVEYRRDWSNVPFFERGMTPAAYKSQNTLLAGFVAYFGPKR